MKQRVAHFSLILAPSQPTPVELCEERKRLLSDSPSYLDGHSPPLGCSPDSAGSFTLHVLLYGVERVGCAEPSSELEPALLFHVVCLQVVSRIACKVASSGESCR